MKMTPAIIVVGSSADLSRPPSSFPSSCPGSPRRAALGYLRERTPLEEAGAADLRQQRLHLLPHPVRPHDRLGHRRRADRPLRRLRPGPAAPARHRAHRPGPLPGGRRAPGRLARGPLRQPALHPARIDHALLRVLRAREDQGADRLQAEPGLQGCRLPRRAAERVEGEGDRGLRGRPGAERRLAARAWCPSRGGTLPNPIPPPPPALARGHRIYQSFCIGCHGPIGDGMGPAQPYLYPPPLNFTLLKGPGASRAESCTTRS